MLPADVVEGQVLTVANQFDHVVANASIGLRIPVVGGVGPLLFLGPKRGAWWWGDHG